MGSDNLKWRRDPRRKGIIATATSHNHTFWIMRGNDNDFELKLNGERVQAYPTEDQCKQHAERMC